MTATAGLREYREHLAGLPAAKFIGSILWYSIAGTVERNVSDGRREVRPVRVSQDQLEQWFEELGLDAAFLPPQIKRIDAFRNASSTVRREYPLDDTRFAELRVEEVKSDAEQVIRHVVQIIRDERKEQLAMHHVATLKFIRGGRTAKGKRHAGDHVKHAVLSRTHGQDRAETESLLEEFYERYDDLAVNLQSPAIRGIIRNYLTSLNAIAMKTSGGVYFVHKEKWPLIDALQELVQRIGQGCVLEQFPLIETEQSRAMLTDAYQEEIEEECRLLHKRIKELNQSKTITPQQFADLNARYQEAAGRAEEYTNKLGLTQGRAAAALEMALSAVLEMSSRLAFAG